MPRHWTLNDKLDENTFTFDLLNSGKACRGLAKQSAEAWFQNENADKYEVREQCICSVAGTALVLIYLQSEMLYAQPDWDARRKYDSSGSHLWKRSAYSK